MWSMFESTQKIFLSQQFHNNYNVSLTKGTALYFLSVIFLM